MYGSGNHSKHQHHSHQDKEKYLHDCQHDNRVGYHIELVNPAVNSVVAEFYLGTLVVLVKSLLFHGILLFDRGVFAG